MQTHQPPLHVSTRRYQTVQARRLARQASFIKEMHSEGFNAYEIQKAFSKLSITKVKQIINS